MAITGPHCILGGKHLSPKIKAAAKYLKWDSEMLRVEIQAWQSSTLKDFDEEYEKNPTATIDEVIEFKRKSFKKEHRLTNTAIVQSYRHMFSVFNQRPQQLTDAIQMVCRKISENYDKFIQSGQNFSGSREDYYRSREHLIYNMVLHSFEKGLNAERPYIPFSDVDNPGNPVFISKEQAELLSKVVGNFPSIWQLAKLNLKNTDGIQLGTRNINIAEDVDVEDVDKTLDAIEQAITVDNDPSYDPETNFEYEEKELEAWQKVKEFLKPMKQLSAETRRILSNIPKYDNKGDIILSEFGIPRFDSPSAIHKRLIVEMYNVKTEEEMIQRLNDISRNNGTSRYFDPQIEHVLSQIDIHQTIESNDALTDEQKNKRLGMMYSNRTALFLDMQKTPMEYRVSKVKRINGWIRRNLVPINTTTAGFGKQLWYKYRNALLSKDFNFSTEKTLFGEGGKIRIRQLNTLKSNYNQLKSVIKRDSTDYNERTEEFFSSLSKPDQIRFVTSFLNQFGIPYNFRQLSRLINRNNSEAKKLISNIFDVMAFVSERKSEDYQMTLGQLLTTSPNTDAGYTIDTAMSQILRIADKGNYQASKLFRPFGRYMNPNKGYVEYQTAQQRGFLTDFFSDIEKAIQDTLKPSNLNANGIPRHNYLHDYIKAKFFKDPMFVVYSKDFDKSGNPQYIYENGHPKFRHRWLTELWESNLTNPNSFANTFSHYQLIGSEKDIADQSAYTVNSDAQTFEDFNGIQFMSTLMQSFVNPMADRSIPAGIRNTYSEYPTYILGDSGKQKMIVSKRYDPDIILKYLEDVVDQEIAFAKNAELFNQSLRDRGYNPPLSNANLYDLKDKTNEILYFKFHNFPELNQRIERESAEEIRKEQNTEEFKRLSKEEQQEKIFEIKTDILNKNKSKWIKEIMEDRLKTFNKKCEREGILEKKKQTVGRGDNKIEYEVYPNLPLGVENGYSWDTSGTQEGAEKNRKTKDKFLRDFYYNSTFAMIEQVQLVTISPAFYPNAVEMQKRYKQAHASGRRPSTQAIGWDGKPYMARKNGQLDTNMNFVLFDDVYGNPRYANNEDYMDAVAYTHGRYQPGYLAWEKNNRQASEEERVQKAIDYGKTTNQYKVVAGKTSFTDGQGLRSLTGYRKVKGALHGWSRQDEDTYNRILDIRELAKSERHIKKNGKEIVIPAGEWTEEEKREISRRTQSWQPIKPFVYGFERLATNTKGVGSRFSVPTQIKCSECVLIPELLPTNSRMRIISQYLEDKDIDCAYFDSCVKVGAFGQVETYNSKKQTREQRQKDEKPSLMSIDELRQNLYGIQTSDDTFESIPFKTPFVHTLSYNDYLEQNTVPVHTYDVRSIGTQMRKIFFDGLKDTENYEHYIGKGKTFTLPNGKKATTADKQQLVKFYSSLHCANVKAQFNDVMRVIKNDATLSAELQKVAMRSSNTSMTKMMMYAVHEVFGEEHFQVPLFENSIEHDAAATLISIFRKASTQLQIEGGSLVQATAYGISEVQYVDGEVKENDLKIICKNHNAIESEAEVPFAQEWTDKYGVKHKLRFEDWCDEDGYPLKDKDGNVLLEKYFPGSTTMLCYRIPSEKHYSAVVLRVKRFTKPIEGGIIRLPIQITSITGADFDIDKMFLMRKQFVQSPNAKSIDQFDNGGYTPKEVKKIWEKIWDSEDYFSGSSILEALKMAKQDAINEADTQEQKEFLQKQHYNYFWYSREGITGAVDAYPTYFQGWDGYKEDEWGEDSTDYTNKERVFNIAAKELGLTPREDNRKDIFIWHEYDLDRSADDQIQIERLRKRGIKTDVVVRNNMQLQLMIARLQDPNTMISRTTPGGFPDAEEGADIMKYMGIADSRFITTVNGKKIFDWDSFNAWREEEPDPNESLNYSDPYTLMQYNKQNQIAAKLVGTFANLNAFKAMMSSVYDVRIKDSFRISLFGRTASSLVQGVDEDGRDSSLYVAELLAAAVDSVKNPTLKFLNITQSTAYVAGLMAMAGYTHTEIGIFLNQPIIRKMTDYCESHHCGLQTAINVIQKEYFEDRQKQENFKGETMTPENLISCFLGSDTSDKIEENKDNPDSEFMNIQFDVLQSITNINKVALALKKYNAATKMTSANSIKSTFGSIYSIIQSAEAMNETDLEDDILTVYTSKGEKGVKPIDSNLDFDDPDYMDKVLDTAFPIEQVIYDVAKNFIKRVQKFFPYEKPVFKKMRDFFRNLTNDKSLTAQTIDQIHHDIQTYVMSTMPNCLFSNATIESSEGIVKSQQYFLRIFPKEFSQFLAENADKYPTMYRCLTVNDDTSTIELNYGYDIDSDRDAFTNEWRQMIDSNTNTNGLNVGECLYFYNFHSNEFRFGTTTFDHLFPQDKLANIVVGYIYDPKTRTQEAIHYADVLGYIMQVDDYELSDNAKIQIFQHHPDNTEIVKQIYNDKDAENFTTVNGNGITTYQDLVVVDTSNYDVDHTFDFIKLSTDEEEGTVTYAAALNIKGNLYIAVNNGQIKNTVSRGELIYYKKYDTKDTRFGAKNESLESNPPLDGNFLEPISWDALANSPSQFYDRINIEFVKNLKNNMFRYLADNQSTLGSGQETVRQYLEFIDQLDNVLKNKPANLNTRQLFQTSLNTLKSGLKAYTNGTPLSEEAIKLIKEANQRVIMESFVDAICPDIGKLTGDQKANIYDSVCNEFTEDLNVTSPTVEDVRDRIIQVLLRNDIRTDIEQNVEKANDLLQIAYYKNDGTNPLLRDENKELMQMCR